MLNTTIEELINKLQAELDRQLAAKEITRRQYLEALTQLANLEDALDSK